MARNHPSPCRHEQKQAAFTLLEVIVALGVGLIVVGAIAAFQSYQLTTLREQAKQIDLQGTTRSVVDLVARELRTTGRNPQCQPALDPLAVAKLTELRMQTDLDGSGTINGANEDVSYRWNSSSQALERVDHGAYVTHLLVEEVDLAGSGFHYFDGNGNEMSASDGLDLAHRLQVRRVRLDLAMRDVSGGAGALPARASASTSVDLRNRFFVADNALCVPSQAPTATQASEPEPTDTPQPDTPACKSKNERCTSNSECCSNNCRNGKCSP